MQAKFGKAMEPIVLMAVAIVLAVIALPHWVNPEQRWSITNVVLSAIA